MLLDSDEDREQGTESEKIQPTAIDIDLDLSALANARKWVACSVISFLMHWSSSNIILIFSRFWAHKNL